MAQSTLPALRERLIKIGARVFVCDGCCVAYRLAEVAVLRSLLSEIPRRINRLRGPPGPAT